MRPTGSPAGSVMNRPNAHVGLIERFIIAAFHHDY